MLSFIAENCVRHLFVRSKCKACISICPHDAITLDDKKIKLDEDKCHQCGLCITACEQGAFQTDTYPFKYPTLNENQIGYACLATNMIEGVKRLPCLGMLDETELITVANKKDAPIQLWMGNCERCNWKKGAIELMKRLKQAEKIAKQLNIPFQVEIHEQNNHTPMDHSPNEENYIPERNKRDFFFQGIKWLEKSSKTFLLKKVDEVMEQVEGVEQFWVDTKSKRITNKEDGQLASHMQKKVTKRRYALLKMVKEQGRSTIMPIEGLAIPKEIEPACDACECCIHSCPTGALHCDSTDGEFTITFLPNYCLNCGVCIDVCPKCAMKQSESLKTTIFRAKQYQCKICRTSYVPQEENDELCIICKNRQRLLI